MSNGFLVNTERCYGCKACMVACAFGHELDTVKGAVFLRRVREFEDEATPGHAFVTMSCNHCDEPACLANCPVSAYTKDPETGLVIQDHEKCIGCQTCVNVCPFHAPRYNEADATTYKCDGCITRLQVGLRPICEKVCPTQAIKMDDFDTIAAEGESIKEVVDTMPNYVATFDKEVTLDMFKDIDATAWDKGIAEF